MNRFNLDKFKIIEIIKNIQDLLFPGYFRNVTNESILINKIKIDIKEEIEKINQIKEEKINADEVVSTFMNKISFILEDLKKDLEMTFISDPAAIDEHEIILTYPGFFATMVYRISHMFYEMGVPYFPRIMSEYAHFRTGIDIHPGATISPYFFIDHGTGVVIGETAIIHSNVKIYQNVTIGALALGRGQALKGTKRHPTILENTTIYSGATILGGDTIIGKNVTIGANVFLTESVKDNMIVVLKPGDLTFTEKIK